MSKKLSISLTLLCFTTFNLYTNNIEDFFYVEEDGQAIGPIKPHLALLTDGKFHLDTKTNNVGGGLTLNVSVGNKNANGCLLLNALSPTIGSKDFTLNLTVGKNYHITPYDDALETLAGVKISDADCVRYTLNGFNASTGGTSAGVQGNYDLTNESDSFTGVTAAASAWTNNTIILEETFQKVAAGRNNSCAITDGGSAKCWGKNENGSVGDGTTTERDTPVQVSGLTSGIIDIDVHVSTPESGDINDWTCAALSDGTVKCWGENTYKLGDAAETTESNTPVTVGGVSTAVAVSVGGHHACALLSNNNVACWGRNSNGQIGNETTADATNGTPVSNMTTAVAISAGKAHTCALTSNGTIDCWGNNDYGQLGINSEDTDKTTPQSVVNPGDVYIAVSAGENHTCALRTDHNLDCWGIGSSGQLGNGASSQSNVPVTVSSLTTAVAVSAGGVHTCAVLADGTGRCWGSRGTYGQLGDGSTTGSSNTPVTVTGLTGATQVSAGYATSCAQTSSGAYCWGWNGDGNVGNDTTATAQSTPAAVYAQTGRIRSIATGNNITCLLKDDNKIMCIGENDVGQRGIGSTATASILDDYVNDGTSDLSTATQVSCGHEHCCAVLSNNTVNCWGEGSDGQLGNGSSTDQTSAVAVSSMTTAVQVATGGGSSCATLSDGSAKCWGDNFDSKLGNSDDTDTDSNTAVSVRNVADDGNLANVLKVTVGLNHACALINDGSVLCWGDGGSGALGNGGIADSDVPTAVSVLTEGVTDLVSGAAYNCAIQYNKMYCWGGNASGQVGDGDTINVLTPTAVSTLSNVYKMAAGWSHTCATTAGGIAYCWGYNGTGALGNGIAGNSSVPVAVLGSHLFESMATGVGQTCGITFGGTAFCWGNSNDNQIAYGGALGGIRVPIVMIGQ